MQKCGPFNLKYRECGSNYLCKYYWVYYMRKRFESNQQRSSLVTCQEILSQQYVIVSSGSFTLNIQMVPRTWCKSKIKL